MQKDQDAIPPFTPTVLSWMTKRVETLDSAAWMRASAAAILKRFEEAAKSVPAYSMFLEHKGVDPATIHGVKDIACIPPISKSNYLRAYPWDNLCTMHALASESLVLTATSGSTGEPFYIPRTDEVHDASMFFHRLFLERTGLAPTKPTLVVIGFGMGVWIGGMLTYEAFHRIKNWPLTLITPGVSKKEIFETLRRIAPSYDQLILVGYPPFIKDLIDEGSRHSIEWKRWDLRIVCAAEAFSEDFREYLMRATGMQDPYRSIMNIYGSAELGTMATETPLSILLRRLAVGHSALYQKLFSQAHRLPTLAQFIPDLTAFEADDEGRILATGGSTLPLIRYDIGDNGGVFSYEDAVRWCAQADIDLAEQIAQAGIKDTVTELPFVYLYERADLSTKLYGAIIYPEHVKIGLLQPEFERAITGRFTMSTEHDASHNEYLEINLELQQDVQEKDAELLHNALVENIMKSLTASSDEYRYLASSIRDKVVPRLVFWPHEHSKYFPPGIKQKWVIRDTGE